MVHPLHSCLIVTKVFLSEKKISDPHPAPNVQIFDRHYVQLAHSAVVLWRSSLICILLARPILLGACLHCEVFLSA